LSQNRLIIVTAAIMLSLFLASVESTVVGTAMPTIISQLGGLAVYSWVFSAYMLTSTTTTPIFGRLSDIYGRRPIYLIGMLLFLVGSALSGQAQSMTQLIVFRAVQGLGAGSVLPMAFTIIGDIYTLEQRARMQGVFSSVWGVSSVIGPLLGGFLVDNVSWRWVFYVNVPFGLIALALVWWGLNEAARRRASRQVDYLGVVLLSSGVFLLLLTLLEGGTAYTWASPRMLGLLGLSIALLAAFVYVESRVAAPILPPSLFRYRLFSVASGHGFLTGLAMFGTTSFVPLFVQGVLGTSATGAGAVLTPLILGWVIASTLGGQLILRLGYRTIIVTGMSIMTAGAAVLATVGLDSTRLHVVASMVLLGAGMGLSVTSYLIAVQNAVRRDEMGIATSALQFSRSIGGTVGVSLMGAVMAGRLLNDLSSFPGAAVPGGQFNPQALLDRTDVLQVPPELLLVLRELLADALHPVFLMGLVAAVLGLAISTLTPRGRAAQLAAAWAVEEA
jgi:EmrB/QacA subfamily drug resistance transporter